MYMHNHFKKPCDLFDISLTFASLSYSCVTYKVLKAGHNALLLEDLPET